MSILAKLLIICLFIIVYQFKESRKKSLKTGKSKKDRQHNGQPDKQWST